ncbi:ParB N-terminal domain-containing protein [uncultured Celeribacter sp.]|uniref:ParB/RepB/Spo0J family partition protein n=1 Tax=uncultured Celeribacter sp. TaxID=1303376 RepID=UPI002AA86AF2|nr:ParB N-terminal domain-containing protein [uncultured Celeribacter sp.]
MTTDLEIALDLIDIPDDRARALNMDWACGLADMIREQGLIHPITVRPVGERYELVAGRHRIGAFEILGRVAIPARISNASNADEARLEEVMENLGRGELNALDRAQHLYELKQVWERMHPNFANGGGKTLPTGFGEPEIFGFATSVAEKIGLSKRTINLAVNIWSGLTPASRSRLVGTDMAKKQTELKALADLSPVRQERVLNLVMDADSPVSNVAGALQALEGGVVADAFERKFTALSENIKSLPDESFSRLVLDNEERVIAALKAAGRI